MLGDELLGISVQLHPPTFFGDKVLIICVVALRPRVLGGKLLGISVGTAPVPPPTFLRADILELVQKCT